MSLGAVLQALRDRSFAGATVREWSLCLQKGKRLGLGIKDREVGNPHAPLKLSESCGASYRLIWSDGRVSRGHLERRQLETEIEPALCAARAAAYDDPDAAWVLGPAPIPEVEMYDPGAAAIAAGDTELFARRLAVVRRRIDSAEVRTWSGSFSASESEARLVTSAGLDATARGTSVGWHVSVNGEVGDGFGARRTESDRDFEQRLDRLMQTSAQLAEEATPMEAGRLPVILDPGVVEEYVLHTLMQNLGGSTVAHGEGHFRLEQFGSSEPVMREDLGLRVDPLADWKSGAYRFTREGVPAAPTTFIAGGRLTQPMLDLKYAKRLGLAPTPLPSSHDTLHFEGPEPISLAEACGIAAGGALILSVLGVHTQDSSNGDFSLSAPQALRLGPGGYAGRLRATISGNLFSILTSDELRFVRFEGEHTPGLLFPCRLDPR
jgi:PmbA protein